MAGAIDIGVDKDCAKFQSINRFSLLLILNLNILHGCVKALMTGEVFYGEWPHSLLM